MHNVIVLKDVKAANKDDIKETLAYLHDALELATMLRQQVDGLPLMIRSVLQDRGEDLCIGMRAECIFMQSILHVERLIKEM